MSRPRSLLGKSPDGPRDLGARDLAPLSGPNRVGPHRGGRPGERGFTLIELVLAVGLLSGSFLAILLLRASAVDRANGFNTQRKVQRIAQEKLEEVVYGIEPELAGQVEGLPDWEWEVDVYSLATTDSLTPLLECSLTLRYPGNNPDSPTEYTVSTRFFASEQHPLRAQAGIETEGTSGGR